MLKYCLGCVKYRGKTTSMYMKDCNGVALGIFGELGATATDYQSPQFADILCGCKSCCINVQESKCYHPLAMAFSVIILDIYIYVYIYIYLDI